MTEQSVTSRLGERLADAGSDQHEVVDLDVEVQLERGCNRHAKNDLA